MFSKSSIYLGRLCGLNAREISTREAPNIHVFTALRSVWCITLQNVGVSQPEPEAGVQTERYNTSLNVGVFQKNNFKKKTTIMADQNLEKEMADLEDAVMGMALQKAKSDIDIHSEELMVKKVNACINLSRAKIELQRLEIERQRLQLDAQRLNLEQLQTKYNIVSDLARKADKIQRAIGKTMVGVFQEEDQQLAAIYKASQKLSELKSISD